MKVGDKVVYIKQSLPDIGLIHNEIYPILDTAECGGCPDGLCIDIGFTIEKGMFGTYCTACGNIINIDDRRFFGHDGFRLVDEVHAEEMISELINSNV